MNSTDILNVMEEPLFDNAIVSFEKHTHNPYASTNLGNYDEIRIPIQRQDTYTSPYFSTLYIRGRLCKSDGTVSVTARFDKLGVLLLFEEIRYELNGITMDRVRNPGMTALMKGYVSFSQNDVTSMHSAG
ncbi:hypothetical protein NQ315_012019 [Exocentrus adspersus]|uniref:Double jelly roll-like domain-containing protein n=1 Tax=Exocentrus adspersus TaxID=1586481 RepID=A0AAV8VI74_9CUCU|nr:hypothetical protein NQ315_012019 [Exocentrus adspersus]